MGQTVNNSGNSIISRSLTCVICQYNRLNKDWLIYCEFITKTVVSIVKQAEVRLCRCEKQTALKNAAIKL